MWHGASNNFVIWGLLHGILISSNHLINKFNFKILESLIIPKFIKVLFTFILVAIAFVFFRVSDSHQSLNIIMGAFSFDNYFYNSYFIHEISNYQKFIMTLSLFVIFLYLTFFKYLI